MFILTEEALQQLSIFFLPLSKIENTALAVIGVVLDSNRHITGDHDSTGVTPIFPLRFFVGKYPKQRNLHTNLKTI